MGKTNEIERLLIKKLNNLINKYINQIINQKELYFKSNFRGIEFIYSVNNRSFKS